MTLSACRMLAACLPRVMAWSPRSLLQKLLVVVLMAVEVLPFLPRREGDGLWVAPGAEGVVDGHKTRRRVLPHGVSRLSVKQSRLEGGLRERKKHAGGLEP